MAESPSRREDENLDLENLARAAYATAFDEGPGDSDPLVDAVLSMTRLRTHIRLPDTPEAESAAGPDLLEAPESDAAFPHYDVVGELARGGMGVIFQGRDLRLGREVAIKVLDARHAGSAALVRRFVEEAQIGGQLQHPGIVPVLELGRGPDRRPFFTMKLVKGRTLAALLEARPDPGHDRHRFLAIFEKVAQTMAYAHARRVVHRDLKPQNVMVGAFGEVQVMDWGLAKVLTEAGEARETAPDAGARGDTRTVIETVRSTEPDTRSQTGSIMGTPAYMPPEQARGNVEQVDARTDVFALGALLCEILTGRPPYTGATLSEIRQKAQAGNLTDALARLETAGADNELVTLTRDCLAQEQADRPEDAGEVADRLSGYLASVEERVRAAEVNAARSETRAAAERRVRKLTVVAAAIVVAAVLLTVGVILKIDHDRRGRAREADARVIAAIESMVAAREQATGGGEGAHWAEAELCAGRARALAEDGDVHPTHRERAFALATRVERDARAATEAAAARDRDRAMVARLEEIRTPRDERDRSDARRRAPEWAAAFRDYGIDVEALSAEEVTRRIAGSPIRDALVTALDQWALDRHLAKDAPKTGRQIAALAAAVDDDPRRQQLREAVLTRDLDTLRAMARAEDVITLGPVDLDSLAGHLARAGDPSAGVRLYRRAVTAHPEDYWLRHRIAHWLSLHRPPHADEALRHAEAAVALRPRSVNAWLLKGMVLRRIGRPRDAKGAFERALAIRPGDYWATLGRGECLCATGEPARGLTAIRAAVAQRPQRPGSHLRLGVALVRQGDRDGGIAAYREALRLDPDFADAACNIGVVLSDEGELEDAERAFRRAIELKPVLVEAQNNLADTLRKMHRYDEALAVAQRARRLAPHDPAVLNTLGLILRRAKRLDEAIDAHRLALKRDPDNTSIQNNLGSALAAAGELDAAMQAFDEAIRLDPKNATATANRGNLFARRRAWPEALATFRAAARLAPDHAEFARKIGSVLENMGRFGEAGRAYARAAELGSASAERSANKCRTWAAQMRKARRIIDGEIESPDAAELLALARLARFAEHHATAAELYENAFVSLKPAERGRHGFDAARSAARAGLGRSPDAAGLEPGARAALLDLSADWLGAFLDGLVTILERHGDKHRAKIRRTLEVVSTCRDLAPLRDAEELAGLPARQQHAWLALWTRVRALAARARSD